MYKILEDLGVELKPVSPRSLLLYKEMLNEQAEKHREIEKKETPSIADALDSTIFAIDIFLNKEKTVTWANAIFKMNEEESKKFSENFDDYNYEEFTRGFQDFLAKLSPIT